MDHNNLAKRLNHIYRPLEWDSNFFNMKSVRIELLNTLEQKDIDLINIYLLKNEFITLVNKKNNIENNRWIGTYTDAYLVDINVQFELDLRSHDIVDLEIENNIDEYIIISNNVKFNRDIMKITESTYQHSRFLNDKNLTKVNNGNIYLDWIYNSFQREDKYFAFYYKNERIIGYLLYSIENLCLRIELIAVSETHRNKNIGSELIRFILEKYKYKLKKILVGTQMNNIKAVNFYYKNGFYVTSIDSIYHLIRESINA